jgi:hypothetical protein
MRSTMAIALGALLAVSACSSGDGAAQSTPAPGGGSGSEPTQAPSASTDDPLGGFRDEDASVLVVIGEQRFEFTNLHCVTMGGALGAASLGGDPQVDISLPPSDWETSAEDWDAPTVRVEGDEPYFDFRAGGDVVEADSRYDGLSQVDTFTSDGYRASGTATFVDTALFGEAPTPITGTFEVNCPRP